MSGTHSESVQLSQLAEFVLAQAKQQGASAAETDISQDQGLSVTARMGAVETLEYHQDQGVSVTVYFGQRKGNASSSDLSEAALAETVKAACRIARYTSEDPCAGLADAALMAKDCPDLDLAHEWDLSAEAAIEMAIIGEQAALESDSKITNSDGSSVSTYIGTGIYANSHGFVGVSRGSRHSISCSVIAEDASGMQRDYDYAVARDALDLPDMQSIGLSAAQRTLSRLGGRSVKTGEYPVLFAPEMARTVVRHVLGAMRGAAIYRGASFLIDKVGERIFPESFNLREEPHLPKALGSAAFDNEGVATQARNWVENGVLQGYILNSYSGRQLGLETTGNAGGTYNLLLTDSGKSQADLLREMGSGLLITELMGQGVNLVTGDYSRGAAGFWVENGVIQYPVEEITIAGNLMTMYQSIIALGNDLDYRGNMRIGSMLLEKMTVAGE